MMDKRDVVMEQHIYNMGFDCGQNGADEVNCHFSLFSSPENTKLWEKGKADGEANPVGE